MEFDRDILIRNARSIFEYHETDNQGYVFYRLDGKKGIRIRETDLQRLLDGQRLAMDFGSSGKGVFYADYSRIEARKEREEQRKQAEAERASKLQHEQQIDQLIPDNDPDLVEYVARLKAGYPPMILRPWHKVFIHAIRTREYNNLVEVLAHGRGWNDTSKEFFRHLTGEALPKTKRDITAFLESWCSTSQTAI